MKSDSTRRSFSTPAAFRTWLIKYHHSRTELYVRCFKVNAKEKGITYSQALDEALCFGWIDGVRHSLDDVSFSVRFTPRKEKSYWSAVNIKKFHALQQDGRVDASGLAAFRRRPKSPPENYSFESRPQKLAPSLEKKLRANKKAWGFFVKQPPWYQRTSAFWVMSGKKEETRLKRLHILIAHAEKNATIPPLTRPLDKSKRKQN